ncbi:putative NAM-associated domain-containing protein [Phytophthora infestans]|uniref:Putative NAM-associated domain-containing protein n=1 Tax=Phytophthora infestans TaxID=4787 RepID=A0A8S9U330_PHYIN|nr:putative NAM-associated domain-containing protein [Phytophthora infestans]
MPKAKGWEREEEVHLCQAQVNVTEDQTVGTDQSMATFWERVHTTFVELEGGATSRNTNALQTHWSNLIRPDVTLCASLPAVLRTLGT